MTEEMNFEYQMMDGKRVWPYWMSYSDIMAAELNWERWEERHAAAVADYAKRYGIHPDQVRTTMTIDGTSIHGEIRFPEEKVDD